MDKATFDKLAGGTAEERAATFTSAPNYTGPRAQSSDPMAHLTIDLTGAAVKAWETVRDISAADRVVVIAVNPEVYVQIAFAGVVIDVAKGRDGAAGKKNLANAMKAAIQAQTSGVSSASTQMWGGIALVPDGRIDYLGVGIAKRPDGAPEQVFDQAQYDTLQTSLKKQLELDAFDAASEKISVPGIQPGNA